MRQSVLYKLFAAATVSLLAEKRYLLSQKEFFEQRVTICVMHYVQIFTESNLDIKMSYGERSTNFTQIKESWNTFKHRYSTVRQFQLTLDPWMHGLLWNIAKSWITLWVQCFLVKINRTILLERVFRTMMSNFESSQLIMKTNLTQLLATFLWEFLQEFF